jgi:hypothetical protein
VSGQVRYPCALRRASHEAIRGSLPLQGIQLYRRADPFVSWEGRFLRSPSLSVLDASSNELRTGPQIRHRTLIQYTGDARIERLDAMIDRTIKRLMQIKTMKQMFDRLEPKLINVAARKATFPIGLLAKSFVGRVLHGIVVLFRKQLCR